MMFPPWISWSWIESSETVSQITLSSFKLRVSGILLNNGRADEYTCFPISHETEKIWYDVDFSKPIILILNILVHSKKED